MGMLDRKDVPSSSSLHFKLVPGRTDVEDEAPPPYSPPSTHSQPTGTKQPFASTSSTSTTSLTTPVANFVYDQRKNVSLKGAYIIDPTLSVPETVLPTLQHGQERKNLQLDRRNGSIKADVRLVGDGMNKPTTINISARNGPVSMKLDANERHTFSLHVSAHNGNISLALPRGYKGRLTTRTENGWINFSTSLSPNVTTFSDRQGERKGFVGDVNSSTYDQRTCSSIYLFVLNGRIKVSYADEVVESQGCGKCGILSKILGLKS